MSRQTLENVIYKKPLREHSGAPSGDDSIVVYVTQEKNGYAVWRFVGGRADNPSAWEYSRDKAIEVGVSQKLFLSGYYIWADATCVAGPFATDQEAWTSLAPENRPKWTWEESGLGR